MLTCQNIEISRGYKTLINNFGVSLFKGSCLNIFGNNGSGKTTLLNYLVSLSEVKQNTILVNQTDILKAQDEYKQLICYIGHNNALYEELTVLENLMFWARIWQREITVPSALECFGLSGYQNYPIHKLSQGWKRKVALARLLISDAKIWILDEPFANLDKASSDYLENLFKIRCNQKGIVIFTSHTPYAGEQITYLNLKDFS